jgi:DDE superfamily endonuclease
MTTRRACPPGACPPAPGPLEQYAAAFDDLFVSVAQQRGFRECLTGLLQPRERNKTLTALAGAEPVVQASHPAVQRLQYFISESPWDAEKINDRRIQLLTAQAATRPHERGVLVVDDTGDRKDGHAMAHVARQYLGSVGKTDNGIVVVSTLWADERVYYPLHVAAYTPAGRLPGGDTDPDFATKAQLAVRLAQRARAAGIAFAALVADSWYGDNPTFITDLDEAGVPFVVALKPNAERKDDQDTTARLTEVARGLGWRSQRQPGAWRPVVRQFRDGHTETWWAGEASMGRWGPDEPVRLVVATTDPGRLPAHSTWYLLTNRPRPDTARAARSPYPAADLSEVVRCYGLRNWVEQGYKQVKDELGWADFQVRSATAIHRHLVLVCTAFSYCWRDWFTQPPPGADPPQESDISPGQPAREGDPSTVHSRQPAVRAGPANHDAVLAEHPTAGPWMVDPHHTAATLLARLVERAPTTRAASPARRHRRR